jgi:hypothetical protein
MVEVVAENEDGTDANDEPCPEFEVLLLSDWVNHRSGEPVPLAAGSGALG